MYYDYFILLLNIFLILFYYLNNFKYNNIIYIYIL